MTAKKKPEDLLPAGAPTKYRPKYCDMLIAHMSRGSGSYLSFAGKIDVCYDTLYEWEKVHPAFSDAKKRGLAKNLLHWEEVGYEGMKNSGGKDQPTFNSTMWIFNMKNRHKWSDNKEVAITTPANNAPQIIVSLPDNGRSAPEKK